MRKVQVPPSFADHYQTIDAGFLLSSVLKAGLHAGKPDNM